MTQTNTITVTVTYTDGTSTHLSLTEPNVVALLAALKTGEHYYNTEMGFGIWIPPERVRSVTMTGAKTPTETTTATTEKKSSDTDTKKRKRGRPKKADLAIVN